MLHKDKVNALIGTSIPATAPPVMDLAQAAGVPMVVPTIISFDTLATPDRIEILRREAKARAIKLATSSGSPCRPAT